MDPCGRKEIKNGATCKGVCPVNTAQKPYPDREGEKRRKGSATSAHEGEITNRKKTQTDVGKNMEKERGVPPPNPAVTSLLPAKHEACSTQEGQVIKGRKDVWGGFARPKVGS